MNKKRIGFLSFWGRGRGLANVTLNYAKMLQDSDYEVFIFKQELNEISDDFKTVNVNVFEYQNYVVEPEVFRKWIVENKLDAVFFNEYDQWQITGTDLVNVAKKCDCKVYGYLVNEKFKPEQAKPYDRIIVPTVTGERFMRTHGIRNFTRIPYSIDFKEFPLMDLNKNEKFTFFHPGGMGGAMNRKNTQAVIQAFNLLCEKHDNVKLVITSQKKLEFPEIDDNDNIFVIEKDLPRKELLEQYYLSDVVVLPSKWETIGIPILEATAAGKPVITSDMSPMNEFIRPNLNGLLCKVTPVKYPEISVYAGEVEPRDLKIAMENSKNKIIHDILCKNARHITNKLYDLEHNKKYLIEFLDGELQ